ncbi:hypothetical protein WMY93_029835 [Mugilogobius chulae]|uniref:Uncharacterized protein n=1 Tax=Mugilogobius chulae TaxID=88201 RepID=A0AAW0MSC2_9GOBI
MPEKKKKPVRVDVAMAEAAVAIEEGPEELREEPEGLREEPVERPEEPVKLPINAVIQILIRKTGARRKRNSSWMRMTCYMFMS